MWHTTAYRSHMFESHTHSDLIAALSLKMCMECLVCKEPAWRVEMAGWFWAQKGQGSPAMMLGARELSCSPKNPRRARMATLEMKL